MRENVSPQTFVALDVQDIRFSATKLAQNDASNENTVIFGRLQQENTGFIGCVDMYFGDN